MKDELYTRKVKHSKYYGELLKADVVAPQSFKPKGQDTTVYVDDLLETLGFNLLISRETSVEKLRYVVADFLNACRVANNRSGLISWPGKNEHYTGGAYGADQMRKVRIALEKEGLIWVFQKSSKGDKLTRIYSYDPDIAPDWLTFEHHGRGECVIVRTAKDSWDNGRTFGGGKKLARKKFLGRIEPLEAHVKQINRCLLRHPLQFWDGREFSWCKRIFNNGRLDNGGRLYGPWQTAPEEERLASTIDDCDVCEIDMKASYPSIINATLDCGLDLGPDPYSKIRFTQTNPEKRALAKDLVSAHISSHSGLSRFPKGIRKKHELKRSDKLADYMDDIFEALPFLRGVHSWGINWMYIESELIVSAIYDLATEDIPAYPVHDSVIARKEDQEIVVDTLRRKMLEKFGEYIHLDVSYFDENNNKVEDLLPNPTTPENLPPPELKFQHNLDNDGEIVLIDEQDL